METPKGEATMKAVAASKRSATTAKRISCCPYMDRDRNRDSSLKIRVYHRWAWFYSFLRI
jgi:hypothetical protein